MHKHLPRHTIRLLVISAMAIFPSRVTPQTSFVPNEKPTLNVSRSQGGIKIDGEFNDPGWLGAARANNFAEHSPRERAKPPVETEVLVTYDDNNFYLGFICHDDPGTVRATMRDRDEIFDDDYMGILLDTYGDAASAYEIFVNPLGLQGDLRMLSSGEEDVRFDIVFESRGKVTDTGYQVEVAIPFSSLRFPDKQAQEWKATFWRNRPRKSRERSTWAAINRNDPCFICQWGTLKGIENVRPGQSLELLPSVIGHQASDLRDENNPRSGLHNGNPDAEGSINLRYLLASNLTIDATYNPDFSQVESDVAQIDVNTTTALFYPEKRPFFQEGSDIFGTWINAVYTRSINDPTAAIKLTGRAGRTTIGYIGARDENAPVIVPFEEQSAVLTLGKSLENVVRLKQTLMEDSHIGALLTDRRLDGSGAGSVVGGDASLRFLKNYRLRVQALASHTEEPDDTAMTSEITPARFDSDRHTAAFDGESYWGHAVYSGISRDARLWNFMLEYSETNPTFRADNGFIERNDRRMGSAWTGLFFRPNSKLLDEVSPMINVARVWNFRGERKDEWLETELQLLLKAQTQVNVNYLWSRETFHGLYFPGIRRFAVSVESNFSKPVSIGMGFTGGRFIARRLETPVLGKGRNFDLWSTIKLWNRLILSPQYSYSRLDYPDGGEIFGGYILRTRINYQFTREWFLRLVVQYDNFDQSLNVEPLLSYKLNPFTIFYVGSTHSYQDLDGTSNLTQTARQFFFKLQYLLRV